MHESRGITIYEEKESRPSPSIAVAGPFQSEDPAVKRAIKLNQRFGEAERSRGKEDHFVLHIPENRATKEYWVVMTHT